MRIWFALIVAPLLALADQSIAFAMVAWSCAHQTTTAMHVVHLSFLAATVASTAAAWQCWRETRPQGSVLHSPVQIHFLAGVATAAAALSALTIIAMWSAAWIIASCVS